MFRQGGEKRLEVLQSGMGHVEAAPAGADSGEGQADPQGEERSIRSSEGAVMTPESHRGENESESNQETDGTGSEEERAFHGGGGLGLRLRLRLGLRV